MRPSKNARHPPKKFKSFKFLYQLVENQIWHSAAIFLANLGYFKNHE